MQEHFKILKVGEQQVLLTRDFDKENEDNAIIKVCTFKENMKAEVTLDYNNEAEQKDAFNIFSQEDAKSFIDYTNQFSEN